MQIIHNAAGQELKQIPLKPYTAEQLHLLVQACRARIPLVARSCELCHMPLDISPRGPLLLCVLRVGRAQNLGLVPIDLPDFQKIYL